MLGGGGGGTFWKEPFQMLVESNRLKILFGKNFGKDGDEDGKVRLFIRGHVEKLAKLLIAILFV